MATTRNHAEQEQTAPTPLTGRDELNLAEFPIALIADRAPAGQKTIHFEDRNGKLTVTGSDAYGLPTAADADVIVALIYLTKLRNNFKDVKINFSKYEIINLLNWRDEGDSYRRLDLAFNRWTGVLLVYDKCWWNNKNKQYVSAKMHILDSVIFSEPGGRSRDGQSQLPLSTFTWNKTFIESCQADNLRQLDLDKYFSLKSAIAKRLYRFLGKRFYLQRDWTFDLNEIAFDRVGLSRSYEGNAGKIKEKLQPAIDELEAVGFLRPSDRHDRYTRIDRGLWTIRLSRQSPTLVAPKPEQPRLVTELVNRGVTRATAVDLVQRHPAALIEQQLEVFDWLVERKDKRVANSPAGYLVKSISTPDGGYKTPKGFTSRAERQRQEEARQVRERQEAEERRRKQEEAAREKAEREHVAAYRKALTADQLRQLEADALAQASEETRQSYDDPCMAPFKKTLLLKMTNEHIRRLLHQQTEPA